jgi:hypothetical protein
MKPFSLFFLFVFYPYQQPVYDFVVRVLNGNIFKITSLKRLIK